MPFKTADLCDDHSDTLQIVAPGFRDFGGKVTFAGVISTLKVFEDNTLVREVLNTAGEGKVLVVDGGGSMRCALLGDQLAELGVKNGWSGIIVYGCIRDSKDISTMNIGVKALDTMPLKSIKRGEGQTDLTLQFHNASFIPGHYVYCDQDGIIISETSLLI